MRMMAPRKKEQVVGVNEQGRVVGESHQWATLTDHECDLMRSMHEEYEVGHPKHLGYRRLAKMFGVGRTTVRQICNYEYRTQQPTRYKKRV